MDASAVLDVPFSSIPCLPLPFVEPPLTFGTEICNYTDESVVEEPLINSPARIVEIFDSPDLPALCPKVHFCDVAEEFPLYQDLPPTIRASS